MFHTQKARQAFDLLWKAIDRAPVAPPCQETDPEIWFPPGQGPSYKLAREFCNRCPVKAECLTYALENDEQEGMFGGLSPVERNQLKRKNGPRLIARGRNARKFL
jgi:WhiB family redox-sensing transcriptional regulator